MFCSNCGASIGVDASFCGKCGLDLAGASVLMPAMAGPASVPMRHVQQVRTDPPPLVFASSQRRAEAKESSSAATAAWILLVFACAGSLIPGLGFGMWLIIAPILLITLVLGVLAISKGRTTSGVMIILMSLVVVPAFVAIAPFVGTLLAVGAADGVNESVSSPGPAPAGPGAIPENGLLGLDLDGGAAAPESVVAQPTPVEQPAAATAEAPPQVELREEAPEPTESPVLQTSSSAVVSGSVEYAVLRSQPTLFSKGLGRLAPGTQIMLRAGVPESEWVSAITSDGREGFLRRGELDIVQ